MNEIKTEEIKKQAKKILDNFASALEKVKIREKKVKKDVGGFREEGSGNKADDGFRERVFENAPEKDGDFIIAEKKKW